MTNAEIVTRTITFVKKTLQGAEGGHDWFHTQRVLLNAELISNNEQIDGLVVSLGLCCTISPMPNFIMATKRWGQNWRKNF
jgi:hypothetical protein